MDRREVLKQGCCVGFCAGAGLLTGCDDDKEQAADQVEMRRLKWWLEHSQKQTARLWEVMGDYLDEADQVAILEQLGRNCAVNIGWAKQYVGKPEGFFEHMNERMGEEIVYDREKGVITVTTRERDCDCRLVNSKITPPVYCACSIGWQKHTYETILGKKVDVEVKESVLRGSKRCVFVITVGKDEVTS